MPALIVLELEERSDDRGFFARTFCQKEFTDHGLTPAVAQCNLSYNHKAGTLRGMHYQLPHRPEAVPKCIVAAPPAPVPCGA